MFVLCLNLLAWVRWGLMDLPPRLLAHLAGVGLALTLWWHRKRYARCGVTGAQAAARLILSHRLSTKIGISTGRLSDHYDPRSDVIALSRSVFNGTTIGALAVAAHEAGHALQKKRWFAPWCLMRLSAPVAGLGLGLCFWVWLIGTMLQNQAMLIAAAGCFGVYLLYLLLQLVCEADASRRGIRELLRHRLLDQTEARIARRVLRAAMGTYIAAFAGLALAGGVFLWPMFLPMGGKPTQIPTRTSASSNLSL